MVRTITAALIVGFLLVSATSLGSDNFKQTFAKKIEPQARAAADAEFERRQCEEELPAFVARLEEKPDSEFLQYKVQELTQMCNERRLRQEAADQQVTSSPPPPPQSRVDRAVQEALRPVDNN